MCWWTNISAKKKQVQEYADLLNRSPKTLSNLFAAYGLPSPLRVIHERTGAEAQRLLLHTSKSAKEIAALLGFEDTAAFSRFSKKQRAKASPVTAGRTNMRHPHPKPDKNPERKKTGQRQTGKANGSFPANGNNRQLFRQNRH